MFKEVMAEVLPFIENIVPLVAKGLSLPLTSGIPVFIFHLLLKAFNCDEKDIPSLIKTILEDPESSDKLVNVQSSLLQEYSQLVKNILRLPDEAEVTIKLKWDQTSVK